MLFVIRMTLSIFFGVIGCFMLQGAIELHQEVTAASRVLSSREIDDDPKSSRVAEKYDRSMLGPISLRYGLAGLFFVCSTASFLIDDRRDGATASARVYGPEDN